MNKISSDRAQIRPAADAIVAVLPLMSGIAGIFSLDRSPIDSSQLQLLGNSIAFRGPDGLQLWSDGRIGLAHAAFRAINETGQLTQPLTLDGEVWITADARLDARAEFVSRLSPEQGPDAQQLSDAALILQAYRIWGEGCLSDFAGDFVFTIWDAREAKLFCARDHFGVKPFFYAQTAGTVVFSNTLQALRSHPAISDRLDDRAIADFLLFGACHDLERSAFAEIRRLPPAHLLTIQHGSIRVRRYWTLPVDSEIHYSRPQDYIDQFRVLLGKAVSDRLHPAKNAVLMSGGLDSTSIAATASRHLQSPAESLRAFTVYCHGEQPDPEYEFASFAADSLQLPISLHCLGPYQLFERWDDPQVVGPEPNPDPLRASNHDWLRTIAQHSRVALTGMGGDPALLASPSHAIAALFSPGFPFLFWRAGRYWRRRGKLPNVGLRTELRRRARRPNAKLPAMPEWLCSDLLKELHLEDRWRDYYGGIAKPIHPLRPEAYNLLCSPQWPPLFESYDSGFTGVTLEVRHPFFDLRLIRFLLALPPIPWCVDKEILREAMDGQLPERIRMRPKTPVADSCFLRKMHDFRSSQEKCQFHPLLSRYVDTARFMSAKETADDFGAWTSLVPLCLNGWLFNARIAQ